jgi:hypothetical protein
VQRPRVARLGEVECAFQHDQLGQRSESGRSGRALAIELGPEIADARHQRAGVGIALDTEGEHADGRERIRQLVLEHVGRRGQGFASLRVLVRVVALPRAFDVMAGELAPQAVGANQVDHAILDLLGERTVLAPE